MIVVISGTNRPGANTRKVAHAVEETLRDAGEPVTLLDLAELPPELFSPASYAAKPDSFAPFQQSVLAAGGLLVVTPEYNGSFPGVLKYFIDMLRFPDSLAGKPACFVGLADGRWGGLRAVEQLEMVFQYRGAHLYGRRLFLPDVSALLDGEGRFNDPVVADRLRETVLGFVSFCRLLSR
jgi:NAD(P)H-dependent FMN reductase